MIAWLITDHRLKFGLALVAFSDREALPLGISKEGESVEFLLELRQNFFTLCPFFLGVPVDSNLDLSVCHG